MNIKNTKTFITEANIKHGGRYDYSKMIYVNSKVKVIITCLEHGDFSQTPSSHLNGNGCKRCGLDKKAKLRTKTTSTFIKEANLVHNNKYCYDKTIYVKGNIKAEIICHTHGIFIQAPEAHLQGKGCVKCHYIVSSNRYSSNAEEFIVKAIDKHKIRYDYSEVIYINSSTKVNIICKQHGIFSQTPNSHTRGSGCPSCAKTGFDTTKPAFLYYISLTNSDDETIYKIGITNLTVKQRVSNMKLKQGVVAKVIDLLEYSKGIDAYNEEQSIHTQFKKYNTSSERAMEFLSNGHTECYDVDIFKTDNNII